MKTEKVIKTIKGRVTIQTNAYGTPEIKVRINGETHKIQCSRYEDTDNIGKVVEALLVSNPKYD